jgi:hypothetical protein
MNEGFRFLLILAGPPILIIRSRRENPQGLSRGRFSGYVQGMNKPVKIEAGERGADFEKAIREGIADADAGRTISYEKIRRWLLSWGTDKELPPPR